jgi:hypothetical protein
MFLPFGALFLDHPLKLVHVLAQLRKGLLHGTGFLGTFLVCTEVGFLHSVFCIPTTILGIVGVVHTSMLLAQVAMFLLMSLLGDSDGSFSTRSLVSLVALVRGFLVGLCIGSVLGT